jgi:bleomycin hydrolase
LLGAVVFGAGLAAPALSQSDKINYVEKYEYPIFREMEEYADSIQARRDSVTAEIRARQEKRKEAEEKAERTLLLDFSNIQTPESPEVFEAVFHYPRIAQFLTGTCWAFAGTSLLEAETARLTGREIKLSEMFTVYWEWVDKARRFVAERGNSRLSSGSQSNAVFRVAKEYGAVPLAAYTGLPDPNYERHNHDAMTTEIWAYLELVEKHEIWDEQRVITAVRRILDHYMTAPPEAFVFEGETHTPRTFADEVLRCVPDDYLTVMSTLSEPFYTQAELKVYDNWQHDSSYYNLPLDEWYAVMKSALQDGYSVTIGGDVSEPGMNGFADAAVVPDYDIPAHYINQHSREFRIHNRTTGNDHGVHVIGYKKIGGRDWFLTKDSSSRGRYGQYEGYMFIRGDYIRLKMLTFTVHRDSMADLLDKFAGIAE